MIYYQSDFCPNQVHKAHGSIPKFSNYGKTIYNLIVPDSKNNKYGTAYIGKNKSAVQVKIYSKSIEVNYLGIKKNYISEIHTKHFGSPDLITRVEVRIKSFIFYSFSDLRHLEQCSPLTPIELVG